MKNALISGGNKGIGLAISRLLLSEGWKVYSVSRSIVPELNNLENFEQIMTDVSNEQACKSVFDNLDQREIKFDCIINNAGFSEWRKIQDIGQEFLESMFAVNVYSYFYLIKFGVSFLNSLGSVINISSLAAMRGTPNNSAYVATKFAVRGMTQSLAKELGPSGIRVNAINPVLIETPGLLNALKAPDSPAKGNPEDFLNLFANSQTALLRLPTADDVAQLASFLVSDKARSITGQSINVDCGVLPN